MNAKKNSPRSGSPAGKPSKGGTTKYTPQKSSSTSTYVLGGLALLVVAAVVIGGVLWQSGSDEPRADGYGSVQNSAVEIDLNDEGVVTLGIPGAPTVVDIYEDAYCPFCGELEQIHGQELAQKIDEGTIGVRYHQLDFLASRSASGTYSTRAAAAAQCVAASETAPVFSAFHSTLFSPDFQPAEGSSSDHTDEQLAQAARDAGASDATAQCIVGGDRVPDASAAAAAASEALAATGAQGTPTVVANGTVVDTRNVDWVAELG